MCCHLEEIHVIILYGWLTYCIELLHMLYVDLCGAGILLLLLLLLLVVVVVTKASVE